MLSRKMTVIGSVVLALSVVLDSTSSAVAAPTPYVYQGTRLHFAGEPQLIAAINSLGWAMAYPLSSEVHVNAAELQIKLALRFLNNRHEQAELNGALHMLNAFRYRGDRAALGWALQRTECALADAQQTRLAARQVYRPVLPQPYPAPVYGPVYPASYAQRGLTIQRGAFSITIPLGIR